MFERQIRSDLVSDDEEVFETEEIIENEEDILEKGDLYIIGQLWISALKTGLLKDNWSIIPSVNAAALPGTPEKPPPMAYKDLPIYETPHYDYKEYREDKFKQKQCPKYKTKVFYEAFHPCVTSWRKYYSDLYKEVNRDLGEIGSDFSSAIIGRKDAFINYMRDPNNYEVRLGTVVAGGLTGFYIGYPGGFPRKIICTGFGLLATGALTFPKATDNAFRDFSYHTCKLLIGVYNKYCNKNFNLRERVPCRDEMPPPPTAKRPANVCPAPTK